MALLALSAGFIGNHALSYSMLIIATGFLGIGFGMVVPVINRMAEMLYPAKSDAAVLFLNALLGVGTALAPIFIALFTAAGFWWGLPLILAAAFLALIFFSLLQELPKETVSSVPKKDRDTKGSGLFWVFVVFAFLYGIIETLNGNWVSIYMSKYLGASINVQSLALTSFWGMVTFGRIFFAGMSRYLSEQTAFQIAPFISTLAFILIASFTSGQAYWAVLAFGLTGFGCSILLPLLISFGGKQLKALASSVPGMIISFYLLGYGVAAFGVGPLEEFQQVSLRTVYVVGAAISLILGALSLVITRKKGMIQM
jgi:fucose permease